MAIDYQDIIENLKDDAVYNLLEQLNIPVQDKGDYFLCKTCCHHSDSEEASWKLYYYKNTHLFVCYSECGAMSFFTFLRNYYEVRGIPYDWYTDIYQVILNCSASSTQIGEPLYKPIRSNYEIQKSRQQLPEIPEGILNVFVKKYPIEWEKDGITDTAMDKYNIRFSNTQNKIIIPHYDAEGRLVGIRGRALNSWDIENFGKYMPVQIEGKWYSHPLSLNLYGLNFNKENIKRRRICYIFEGEKSPLLCENLDEPNCAVASCGSNLNKFQIDLLMRYCQPHEIVVCYDSEEIGNSDKYFQKLYKMCQRYTQYANMSFIYDFKGLLDLKDAPIDKGADIFYKLLKERVKVK